MDYLTTVDAAMRAQELKSGVDTVELALATMDPDEAYQLLVYYLRATYPLPQNRDHVNTLVARIIEDEFEDNQGILNFTWEDK